MRGRRGSRGTGAWPGARSVTKLRAGGTQALACTNCGMRRRRVTRPCGGLGRRQERYEAGGRWYSGTGLHKLWNAQKKGDPALGWWAQNSKCAYQEAFRDLDRALRDFTASRKGERKGRRLGFPRFKKRGKCRDSFRFSTGVMRCAGSTVTLPRLGAIG